MKKQKDIKCKNCVHWRGNHKCVSQPKPSMHAYAKATEDDYCTLFVATQEEDNERTYTFKGTPT